MKLSVQMKKKIKEILIDQIDYQLGSDRGASLSEPIFNIVPGVIDGESGDFYPEVEEYIEELINAAIEAAVSAVQRG